MLPFSDETVTNRFSSGKAPIDRFLKNKAKKMTRRYEQRVFCAHLDGSAVAIGFYALQLGTDSVDDLPNANKNNYLKNKTAFPAVHLSHVGVDIAYQRQGLGQYLLMDVFSKAARIAECAGFYALTLQSLDKDSTAFYQSLNFTVYSENRKRCFDHTCER